MRDFETPETSNFNFNSPQLEVDPVPGFDSQVGVSLDSEPCTRLLPNNKSARCFDSRFDVTEVQGNKTVLQLTMNEESAKNGERKIPVLHKSKGLFT